MRWLDLPPGLFLPSASLSSSAACLAASAGTAIGYRQYQGREARRELKLALDIAAAKTSRIQTQLREFSR